jgi:AraC-like DNA-binding protein
LTYILFREIKTNPLQKRAPSFFGGAMSKVDIVWVDLRGEHCAEGHSRTMPECFETLQVKSLVAIQPAIAANSPRGICFEYDDPVTEQRKALQETRLAWPALPVMMLTVTHSEELAVWALRMRVWDYVVKPLSREDLCLKLALLMHVPDSRQVAANKQGFSTLAGSLQNPSPAGRARTEAERCGKAMSFVEENLAEKISLHEVAELCGLGLFQFSRTFKEERGITFREFLIQRRIGRALQLFDTSRGSVTDVAFAAGFNDLSYFARVFRRVTGVTPSHYRKKRELRDTLRLPFPEPQQNPPGEWPIAKFSYPSARKS